MSEIQLPIFPLQTVLFPKGKLPLRIFERRYIDMIKNCMQTDQGFGIVLISDGQEVRPAKTSLGPSICEVGTIAKIIDFDQIEGGLLGILVEGGDKFSIRSSWEAPDHLLIGKVEILDEGLGQQIRDGDDHLVQILHELVKHPMIEKLGLEIDFSDTKEVGFRLAELLPIAPKIKQSLLQLSDADQRLAEIKKLLSDFEN